MRQNIPSSPVAPARWPSLVQSVGGEAAIRTFTAANSGDGGNPKRWEGGVQWPAGIICQSDSGVPYNGIPITSVPCADQAFTNADGAGYSVDMHDGDPLYYWSAVVPSTFCSDAENSAKAAEFLRMSTSFQLEQELWYGSQHTALGLAGPFLTNGNLSNLGTFPLVYALAELVQAFGQYSFGQRAMIHTSAYVAMLWHTAGAIRKEGGLLLDAMDNIIVAGSAYPTYDAYITPTVDVHLGEIETLNAVDSINNRALTIAFRPGLVKYDDCVGYSVTVDTASVCG